MRRVLAVTGVLLMVALAACSEETPGSAPDTTAPPETTAPPTGGGGQAANGETLYNGTCQGCHGVAGVGIEGLGKPLVGSQFVDGLTDDELATFIEVGRTSSDPENTTGIAMPPKGGNPALADADLLDIVAYIRTLNP